VSCPDDDKNLEEEVEAALLLLQQEDMETVDISHLLEYYQDEIDEDDDDSGDDEEEKVLVTASTTPKETDETTATAVTAVTADDDSTEETEEVLNSNNNEDDMATTTTTTSSSSDGNNKNTVKEFFATFQNLGVSWGHILRSYQRIIGLAGGGDDQPDDVYVTTTMDDALVQLRHMATDLPVHPAVLHTFEKTGDDLLVAFLTWVMNSNGKNGNGNNNGNGNSKATDNVTTKTSNNVAAKCKGGVNTASITTATMTTDAKQQPPPLSINVSKAFRRFQAYVEWMENSDKALRTVDGKHPMTHLVPNPQVYDAFAMRVTQDACGRIVWWMDLEQTDEIMIRTVLHPHEIRRFFIWFAHFVMFHPNAQQNGIVFMNSLAHMAIWDFMTMLPLELGIQTDEFMICVIPLKTKMIAFFNRPAWAKFAFGLLRVFLNRHMRNRVLMVHDGIDNMKKRWKRQREALQQVLGGKVEDLVPRGFVGLDDVGRTDIDLLEQFYQSSQQQQLLLQPPSE
jgi:hypothetical protein